jgi:hypothetical protein
VRLTDGSTLEEPLNVEGFVSKVAVDKAAPNVDVYLYTYSGE